MESLDNTHKTRAILKNRNVKVVRDVQRLEMELAAVQCENDKLRKIANLENEQDFLSAIYGNFDKD